LKNEHVDAERVAAIGYCFGGSAVQALAYTGAPLVGIVSFHGGLLPVPADAAAKTKAKLLFCNGAADPSIKPEAITALETSLEAGGFDYQFINYAHAKHAFTNPDADKLAAAGLSIVAYNAAADHRSWEHMKVFFREVFGARK
jgi:dienelactone hydrolase